jgi:lipopolysaccharide biosynthesis glycosyltransferase
MQEQAVPMRSASPSADAPSPDVANPDAADPVAAFPDVISPDPTGAPMLLVVIDCEEDFDWAYPLQNTLYSLDSTQNLDVVQDVFADFGVVPTYVVGYPIVDHETSWQPLDRLLNAGLCLIGAHLHPWVTPPYLEASTLRNSYLGNLPAELELAKLQTLTDRVTERFGVRPTVYKAGRYGFGPGTVANLQALGFRLDVSVMPHWDYRETNGPAFLSNTASPFWLDEANGILEFPVTAGFTGLARRLGPTLYPLISRGWPLALRLPAVLARSGLLNRVRLTPEGVTLNEAKALTRSLLRDGQRVFQLTFHSTSLVPRSAPYVRTDLERDRFIGWIRQYLQFFRDEVGGVPVVPDQVFAHMSRAVPQPAPEAVETMHVLLCCNALYFQHLSVVITSLAEHTTTRTINVVVAIEQDSPEGISKLQGTLRRFPHLTVSFRVFRPGPELQLPVRAHYTRDIYTRLWIADFFDATVDRVLYLDCDMVIVGSLEQLWTAPLDGRTLGAVSIPGSTRCPMFGIPEVFGYFNSGVLLVDLARWRQIGAFQRVLEYILQNRAALIDPDQDALNATLYDERTKLDYIWNVTSPFYFDYHDLRLSPTEVRRVQQQARVIHFNGASKPWSYFSRHPRRGDYYRILRLTAWRDFRPPDRTPLNRLRRLAGMLLPDIVKRRLKG